MDELYLKTQVEFVAFLTSKNRHPTEEEISKRLEVNIETARELIKKIALSLI